MSQEKRVSFKNITNAAACVFALLMGSVAFSQNWETGLWDYNHNSYRRAFGNWEPLAVKGDFRAQFYLGLMYADGRGVEKNDAEAVKWYRRAAEQDYAVAQFELGMMYTTGRGVTHSFSDAAKWYRKAAEQGHGSAQNNLGLMYLHKQIDAENADEKAAAWFRRGSEGGEPSAYANLGFVYTYGKGVPRNDAEALKWLRKAAECGIEHGQYTLGVMYEEGRGVDRSLREAIKWYQEAEKNGDSRARKKLDALVASAVSGSS